jgi:hypothetical protein
VYSREETVDRTLKHVCEQRNWLGWFVEQEKFRGNKDKQGEGIGVFLTRLMSHGILNKQCP